MNRVWYAAYASNLLRSRFSLYLTGGVLPANGRLHPGARDPSPPLADTPLWLPGTVYFATESATWPGTGRALYDPDTPGESGESAGRGWLVTRDQFLDVVAQEMRYEPGSFGPVHGDALPSVAGERLRLGPGHYETLVCTGQLDGYPVITMAAPWKMGDVPLLPLAGPYRDMISEGLTETFGWDRDATEKYLSTLPGGRCPGERQPGQGAGNPVDDHAAARPETG